MKSKTQQISEALAAGDRMNALRIASRFHDRSRDTMIYKREPLTQLVDRARLAERASVQGEQEISANSHSGFHRTGFEFADFPNHWGDLGHLKQTEQHLLAQQIYRHV